MSLIPGEFKKLREEIDVRFEDKQNQIVEIRDKLPGIYEEIEKIKERMENERLRLLEAAQETMTDKLSMKKMVSLQWETQEHKYSADVDLANP